MYSVSLVSNGIKNSYPIQDASQQSLKLVMAMDRINLYVFPASKCISEVETEVEGLDKLYQDS